MSAAAGSSSSSSSSSSSAAAVKASDSVHVQRLREAHERMLSNWKGLLTGNPNEKTLTTAFLKFMEEYPDAKRRVSGPNADATMLSLALPRLFPTLAATAPEILERVVRDITDVATANTKEELNTIIAERELHVKLAELDKLVEEAEKDGKEARPVPLEILPEDEHRSHAMEVKLAHEKQLRKMLETLRKDNASLDGEVQAMDGRARVVKASVEAKAAAIADMAKAAQEATEAGLGAVEAGEQEKKR